MYTVSKEIHFHTLYRAVKAISWREFQLRLIKMKTLYLYTGFSSENLMLRPDMRLQTSFIKKTHALEINNGLYLKQKADKHILDSGHFS